MDDATPALKTCDVCGDPLRPDNTIGVCHDASKPECDKECRRRQRAANPQPPAPKRPRLAQCEVCQRPLNANNKSGLCDGKKSPPCRKERSRRSAARRSVAVKADPRADAPRCDVCGSRLNRNNTMGVCGDPWKPACRRERKHRKAAGMIPGPKGPAIVAGDVFGNWTALEDARIETMFILCRCACGNSERRILGRNLVLQISRDCGCLYRKKAARERHPDPYLRAGSVFGRLTLLEDVWHARDGARCRCECNGAEVAVTLPQNLKDGRTKSCGCLKREGQRTHGLSKHPLYSTWRSIINRCTNPKTPGFENWGGRLKPIKVCDRWLDLAMFIEDIEREIGPRPEGKTRSGARLYTIDRWPDNDGDYRPGNVRWATQSQQVLNQRKVGTLTEQRDALSIALDECAAERDVLAARCDALAAEVERLRQRLAGRGRKPKTPAPDALF